MNHKLEAFFDKYKLIVFPLILVLAVLFPFMGASLFVMRMSIMIGIYVILALGLNLLIGYTGLMSLGHAGFFAIGAYTTAILFMRLELPFLLAMVGGAALAGILGFVLGLPSLRLSGRYLSIVTLGFGEITRTVIMTWTNVTGGMPGLRPPRAQVFGTDLTVGNGGLYFLMLGSLVLVTLACYTMIRSRTGRALVAIKEDTIAATMMGIRVTRFKVLSFSLSALICGIGGGVYAALMPMLDSSMFTFDESIMIVSVIVIGGMGTIRGMFLGSFILITFPEMARFMMDYRFVVYGLLLVGMMLFRPQGILGWKSRLPYRLSREACETLGIEPRPTFGLSRFSRTGKGGGAA
ncbi:MAG: branched-chain amino acid ABC transporter permease [Oscillospiraceae bacterium]|nr:branched-chain amino acid ABC transporter permease [Oscillospiraceae bacterium]